MKKRIILCGKAASGKDYFRDFLMLKEKKISVSKTTRPQRDGETPGYTYDYISDEEFLEMKEEGSFHEHVIFNGWGYGTTKESFENDEVFIFTPSGIDTLSREEINNSVVVYFEIPYDVRFNRLDERSDSDQIQRRMNADSLDFMDFDEWDIRVTNPMYDPDALLDTINSYMEI